MWHRTNELLCRIALALEARMQSTLGLAVSSVTGRRSTMSLVPPIEIVDVEKVLLSIAPKDADGQPVSTGPFTWTADNSANPVPVITLEPQPDGLSAWAISGVAGVCTVTVTDGTLTDQITITVKVGKPSSLNLSAGAPVVE